MLEEIAPVRRHRRRDLAYGLAAGPVEERVLGPLLVRDRDLDGQAGSVRSGGDGRGIGVTDEIALHGGSDRIAP